MSEIAGCLCETQGCSLPGKTQMPIGEVGVNQHTTHKNEISVIEN